MRPEQSRSRRSPVSSIPRTCRAKAALSTALDPQGSGSLVGWDNPDSGNKGSFTPVGKPFPVEAGVCRVFLAEVNRKGACSDERGEWTIAEAKPWKKT
jgi:surface antigen